MKIVNLPAVTNREDFELFIRLRDADDGTEIEPVDGDEFVFDIKDVNNCIRLSGSTDNGKITVIDDTVVRVAFTRLEMSALPAGSYSYGFTFSRDDETAQPLIGALPVRDGVVSI